MNNKNAVLVPTVPISGLLGVAFIVLKLCGIIGWSWLWVLAPFWIPLILAGVLFLGCILFGFAIGIFARILERSK